MEAWTPSQVNSFRVSTVADRLNHHVGATPKDDPFEFFNLCLSLARGIDYAVANSEVPGKAQELPKLLKKVCARKTLLIQAAIMVLMVSVKSACKSGWFPNEDSRELLLLAEEVAGSFSSIRDMKTEANDSSQNISTIIERFYPQLKMGLTLSVLEVKPGFGTYVTDFHIPKNIKVSEEEKVRLFVAQTDNMETSSCLISPPQANFLINGKGVERRTNVSVEAGPLLPTIIMHMLKYGTNILQVVGQFTGNYVIVVAYMCVISNLDKSVLLDYVQPEVAVQDQDSELVEGPSRISLNCPISFKRIKTPVKGHSCKHIGCFDLDNYVDINSRRPSWRCPHCNQSVCYVDIRVDQYMAKALNWDSAVVEGTKKVLKEVEKDVSEVIISADESWKPVTKGNGNSNSLADTTSSGPEDVPTQQKNDISNVPLALLDLTEGDDDIAEAGPIEIQDVKPILADMPNHFGIENATVAKNNPSAVNQNGGNQIEPDFWSRMFLSTYSGEGHGPRPHTQMFSSGSDSALSNLQLLQSQFDNNVVNNEYGNDPLVTRPRVSTAIQALPALSPISVPQYTQLKNISPNANSSISDGLGTNYGNVERQMQDTRSPLSSLQASQTNPIHGTPVNPFPHFQNQNRHPQSQLSQSIRPPNLRVPHNMVQSPNLGRSSSQSPRNHIASPQQQTPSAQHPFIGGMRRHPTTTPVFSQPNRVTSLVPMSGDRIRGLMGEQGVNIIDSSSPLVGSTNSNSQNEEGSWRPTGRMRGALQGQAYSAALQQFIYQPAQPVQATRPPLLSVPLLVANTPVVSASTANVPVPTSAPQ